ncbi:MAG: hypothetical protein ACK55Z_04155, partial [bacterium]
PAPITTLFSPKSWPQPAVKAPNRPKSSQKPPTVSQDFTQEQKLVSHPWGVKRKANNPQKLHPSQTRPTASKTNHSDSRR